MNGVWEEDGKLHRKLVEGVERKRIDGDCVLDGH